MSSAPVLSGRSEATTIQRNGADHRNAIAPIAPAPSATTTGPNLIRMAAIPLEDTDPDGGDHEQRHQGHHRGGGGLAAVVQLGRGLEDVKQQEVGGVVGPAFGHDDDVVDA